MPFSSKDFPGRKFHSQQEYLEAKQEKLALERELNGQETLEVDVDGGESAPSEGHQGAG